MHDSLLAMLYLCTGTIGIIITTTIIMEHTIAPSHGHKLCGHTDSLCPAGVRGRDEEQR